MNRPQRQPAPSASPKAASAPLRPDLQQAKPYFAPRPAAAAAAPRPAGGALPNLLPAEAREQLSAQARRLPGFPLLTVLLGYDPLSGRTVPRTALALAHGVLALTPGGELRYQQLAQSGVLGQAAAWLTAQAERRHLSQARVSQRLQQAWHDVSGTDLLLHPIDTVAHLVQHLRQLAYDVLSFARAVAGQVVELVFSAVLGEKGAEVLAVLRRAGTLFGTILRDPVRFVGYLVQAARQGFQQFSLHAPQHLQQGLAGWLLGGPLAGLGLQLPARLDARGVLSLALQALGLTYDYLRIKLVDRVGEPAVQRLEQGVTLVHTLMTRGLSAAGEQLSDMAGSLRDSIIDGIRQWVERTIITQAVTKVATLLVPGGAFVEAIRATYNTVMFFVERARQLGAVATSFLESVAAIAAGQVGAAATRVEQTMGRLVPVVLAFLARLLGLGNLSATLAGLLRRARQPLERGLTRLVDWIVRLGQKVLLAGQQAVGTATERLGPRKQFRLPNHEQHTLFFQGAELMMASDPKPYLDFLNTLHLPPGDALVTRRLQQARLLAATLKRLNYQQQHRAPTTPDLTPAIEQHLLQLAVLTLQLMQADQNPANQGLIQQNAQPELSGVTRAGFGQRMHMAYLNYATVAGALTSSGTRPTGYGSNPRFDELNQRRTASGASYYVRGHLLSMKLNGTGTDWRNLTPLSRDGNRLHEEQVESALKNAARHVPGRLNRAFAYTVVPRYDRAAPTSLLGQLSPTPSKRERALERILVQEQFVPTGLVCAFREIDPTSRQILPNGAQLETVVDNPIDQSSLAAYHIGGKHPAIDVNSVPNRFALIDIGFTFADAGALFANTKLFTTKDELLNFTPISISRPQWQALVKARLKSGELFL